MTLRNPNIERMLHLGLTGMIEALEEQYEEQDHVSGVETLSVRDRRTMRVERAVAHRTTRSSLGRWLMNPYGRRGCASVRRSRMRTVWR